MHRLFFLSRYFLPLPGPVLSLSLMTGVCILATLAASCTEAPPQFTADANADSVFSAVIIPSLETECQGCHFRGGEMYSSMPFDDSRVILGRFDEIAVRLEKQPAAQLRAWKSLILESNPR